ncbi:MAG TPA: acyl-CoA dehydratase activase-related protein, partial [Anaeromyxobacter sp.]
ESCRKLAASVGAGGEATWRAAFARARTAQLEFDAWLLEQGRAALERAAKDGVVPVVVLGRTYTIHDDILNSNLPSILREQGALAIPVDAFPVRDDAPIFENMFWGHGHRNLRAAWQIRRTDGVYALFASNYSCGPDSFTHHFIQDLLAGKPFTTIETDGHAGDAGTKTRVEAFLHCVEEHRVSGVQRPARPAERLTVRSASIQDIQDAGETILIPHMSDASEALKAVLEGKGLRAEVLPEPEDDELRIGRRQTSGKECLPMTLTLGSLLARLQRASPDEKFAFFMPGSDGPCRFGAYKEIHQLVCDRLGYGDRVRIWAPPFGDYFRGLPPGFGAAALAGFVALDHLRDLLLDVRPRELAQGEAQKAYARGLAAVGDLLREQVKGDLSLKRLLWEIGSGKIWGLPKLLGQIATEFAALRGPADLPAVLVVGEIYLRNVASANGRVVEELERRGIRTKVAPITEFLAFSDFIGARLKRRDVGERISAWVRHKTEATIAKAVAKPMGWRLPTAIDEVVKMASPWVRDSLETETVLTVGASLDSWRRREVDGVVSVGPLECMPNKIAETQLVHIGEREGLGSLTFSLNGDPLDPEPLDAFALEVKARHKARRGPGTPPPGSPVTRVIPGMGRLEPEGA